MYPSTFLSALMALLCCWSVVAAEQSADEQAITAANREIAAALVAGSPERYAAAFTEDASLLAPGMHLQGRDQILAQQREWFTQILIVKAELKTVHLQVNGNFAHEVGTFSYTFQKRDQLDSWSMKGQYLALWHRQPDGKWKLKADAGIPNPGK